GVFVGFYLPSQSAMPTAPPEWEPLVRSRRGGRAMLAPTDMMWFKVSLSLSSSSGIALRDSSLPLKNDSAGRCSEGSREGDVSPVPTEYD
ncbi:MAG: hypothetical protein J6S10_01855, partial [Clostridia bacterium]|nr:hypothetical protein [Clostridia bacterium]